VVVELSEKRLHNAQAKVSYGGQPPGLEDEQRLVVAEKADDRQMRKREFIPVRFSSLINSH
jgi:hypothetical protein